MKWISKYKHPESWQFIIEKEVMFDSINRENFIGFYLRISDKDGNDMYDSLQEYFESAQDQALEKFGVPLDSWEQVE